MDDKNLKKDAAFSESTELDVEWGENHQERILDNSPRAKSERHACKGPGCVKAFEKS